MLGENAYDLENGEASVFARELKGQDKGSFAVQHRRMIVAGRDTSATTGAWPATAPVIMTK